MCEIDLRIGGDYRFVWSGERGEMGMGGVYREVEPPELYSATEVFDEPWYPGEGFARSVLVEDAGRTTLTTTVLYESMEARDIAVGSGMEKGLAVAYDRLEQLLAAGEVDAG